MAISWIPVISNLTGKLLSGFVYLLNYTVGAVKHLPFSGMHDLYFPWIKVIFMYFLILLLLPLLLKSRIKLLIPTMVTILGLIFYNSYHKLGVLQQNRMVIYSIKQASAFDFIVEDKHVLLIDSSMLNKSEALEYQFANSRINWGLEENYHPVNDVYIDEDLGLYYDGQFGYFKDKTFMRVAEQVPVPSEDTVEFDFMIISGRTSIQIEKLLKSIKFNFLIIDSSVPFYKQKQIEEQANELKIKYYNVNERGAFILNL
jgi:competence protein ComEC